MESLMENLIEVLEKQSAEYEELLELSHKKTPLIVSGDLDNLQKVTDDEQIVVSRLQNLEKKRIEVTADIANVLNRDVEKLKLTNLIEMMAARPEEQAKLAESHDRLRSAVHSLQQSNEHNRELLTNALEMVEFEMNLLQASRMAPETANSNTRAYSSGEMMGTVSGGFDAKQ